MVAPPIDELLREVMSRKPRERWTPEREPELAEVEAHAAYLRALRQQAGAAGVMAGYWYGRVEELKAAWEEARAA